MYFVFFFKCELAPSTRIYIYEYRLVKIVTRDKMAGSTKNSSMKQWIARNKLREQIGKRKRETKNASTVRMQFIMNRFLSLRQHIAQSHITLQCYKRTDTHTQRERGNWPVEWERFRNVISATIHFLHLNLFENIDECMHFYYHLSWVTFEYCQYYTKNGCVCLHYIELKFYVEIPQFTYNHTHTHVSDGLVG